MKPRTIRVSTAIVTISLRLIRKGMLIIFIIAAVFLFVQIVYNTVTETPHSSEHISLNLLLNSHLSKYRVAFSRQSMGFTTPRRENGNFLSAKVFHNCSTMTFATQGVSHLAK